MGAFKDLTRQKFGTLTPLEISGKSASGQMIWKCLCDCGKIKNILSTSLVQGKTSSCGAFIHRNYVFPEYRQDLKGKIFGKLTVLEYAGKNTQGAAKWKCQCVCGTVINYLPYQLTGGKKTCCNSCLRLTNLIGRKYGKLTVIDHGSKKGLNGHSWICKCECGKISEVLGSNLNRKRGTKTCGCGRILRIKDISNQIFGRLKVIKFIYSKNYRAIWECLCECGKLKNISIGDLQSGRTKSCGCLNKEINSKRVGPKSANWRFDLTEQERKERENKRTGCAKCKEWREAIFKRDNYTCRLSGTTKSPFCAHHIEGWTKNPELRFVLDNGITLSEKIHKLFHHIYGTKKSTRKNFEEFTTRYKLGEFEEILKTIK